MDLIGTIRLLLEGGRSSSLRVPMYLGASNIIGQEEYYSYMVDLSELGELHLGESRRVYFQFKFSDDDRFVLKVQKGQIIELREGRKKIGEFEIEEILNDKLKITQ